MIAIIDYGMGNLRSVQKGFEHVGVAAEVTHDADRIGAAHGVVLPGVGAFAACMENLTRFGLVDPVRRAIDTGKPFLGICLGLQLLFEESEEFGPVAGLGVFAGRCVRFRDQGEAGLRIPHMGWNQLQVKRTVPHLEGVADGDYVYFVHSYYVVPEDPDIVVTTTGYGGEFVSSVARDNVFACQFHPEKSQRLGLGILANFGAVVRGEKPASVVEAV